MVSVVVDAHVRGLNMALLHVMDVQVPVNNSNTSYLTEKTYEM